MNKTKQPLHRLALLAQRGFSLIELMVTLSIVATVMFIGIPSMASWLQSSQIRNAAESIQAGLQLAKVEAVSRNANVQFVLPTLAAGTGNTTDWVVSCVTPSAICPGAGFTPAQIQQRFGINGSVNASIAVDASSSAFPAAGTITFNPFGRMVTTPAAPTAEYRLLITNPTGGTCVTAGGRMRCLAIGVSGGGHVRMCDPSLPAPPANPRGC